jgi:RNA polymerase sigma-70 factor, ECF subfamily
MSKPHPPDRMVTTHPLARTADLLAAHRGGDRDALGVLLARFRPLLQRWAHGRLPARVRHGLDTEDLVQDAVVRALTRIEGFESWHDGAFLGFLRTTCRNLIIDRVRAANRRPHYVEIDAELADGAPSPVEQAIGRENYERYERALAQLPAAQAQAFVLRNEYDLSFEEIARLMERPTAEAARKLVNRAQFRIATLMAAADA